MLDSQTYRWNVNVFTSRDVDSSKRQRFSPWLCRFQCCSSATGCSGSVFALMSKNCQKKNLSEKTKSLICLVVKPSDSFAHFWCCRLPSFLPRTRILVFCLLQTFCHFPFSLCLLFSIKCMFSLALNKWLVGIFECCLDIHNVQNAAPCFIHHPHFAVAVHQK